MPRWVSRKGLMLSTGQRVRSNPSNGDTNNNRNPKFELFPILSKSKNLVEMVVTKGLNLLLKHNAGRLLLVKPSEWERVSTA